ncbi:hypothetical protein [Lentilactobacillus parabuchneri]|jgi:hypothetical protein|nr:hypothetical protein [Lentilactobacillus parabuchneri]MCI1922606.1 hypothetical protein [Lentilactobacillus buchneri]MCI1950698.1 hypothetical protein [Lentilactobacillus buchneri]MCI2018225.1 hypothetical protein [Lentilactobacillus buchneri]MCI2027824.1 hypothetical protein [Lentilactobacillus buchneri]MDB1104712.1 hypothetical protein [Lentilactobacillus parabuchneri]
MNSKIEINVTNLNELKKLLQQTLEDVEQLKTDLDKIRNFQIKVQAD